MIFMKTFFLIVETDTRKGGEDVKLGNKVLSVVMLAIIMTFMAIPTFAATGNEVTPFYNNISTTEIVFTISENGVGAVSFVCRGYRGITTSITAETRIERLSGSSWVQVEGASWTDTSTLYYCVKEHSIQLPAHGTYKAVVTFTVAGSGGATDVVTREIQKTY